MYLYKAYYTRMIAPGAHTNDTYNNILRKTPYLYICGRLEHVLFQPLHLVREQGRRYGASPHLRRGRQAGRADDVAHREHAGVGRPERFIHLQRRVSYRGGGRGGRGGRGGTQSIAKESQHV